MLGFTSPAPLCWSRRGTRRPRSEPTRGLLAASRWSRGRSFFRCRVKPVLWIRDILVRIRIRGSVPLWPMNPDPDHAIFVFDLQDANKKLFFFSTFFCLLLFEGTFTSLFLDKKSWRSHKTVWIKVFLTIFAWSKDLDPYLWLTNPDPDPGCPKTYGSNGSGSTTL